ncbi:MAG: LptF/LptG family permease [Planctomycetota bacterium]
MPAVPLTIWRYVLAELWRLLALTGTILVAVLSFAIAVKFLAEGRLGPAETLKFMLFMAPPMLAYAVPFSAGFAATLTYHRLAADNETLAAHAGGVSHRALLGPAILSGLLLCGGMLLLNRQVIPRFLQSTEELIAQDLTKVMVSSIRRGEPIVFNNLMVHADRVLQLDPEQDESLRSAGVTEWLVLRGAVLVELDNAGKPSNEAVVSEVDVLLRPVEDPDGSRRNVAIIAVKNGVGWAEDGSVAEFTRLDPIVRDVPNAFEDDPKFLTAGELHRLNRLPDRMSFIVQRYNRLAHHYAERRTIIDLIDELNNTGRTRLEMADRTLTVHADRITRDGSRWRFDNDDPDARIRVDQWRDGPDGTRLAGDRSEFLARRAWLDSELDGDKHVTDLSFQLLLDDVVTDARDDESGERNEIGFQRLRPARDPLPEIRNLTAEQLLARTGEWVEGVPDEQVDQFIKQPHDDLKNRIERLRREILSKQHERIAMAIAGLVMVLTGAVTAMRLRDALPLKVYLWSFFPALGTIVTIASGQQLVHDDGPWALIILYGGVIALAVYTFIAYLGLRRH